MIYLKKNAAKMEMLSNSPYFYKKTTIRTLINFTFKYGRC